MLISRHPYWTAFILGLIYYGWAVSWMFGIRTSEIAEGQAVKYVALSAGIIMFTSFAVCLPFFLWVVKKLKLEIGSLRFTLLIPIVWVAIEYFRAVFFSVVSYGPTAKIGPFWTYGNLGYWLGETPLSYAGRFGGLYLLSFIGAFLITGIIYDIKNRRVILSPALLVFFSLMSLIGYHVYKTPQGANMNVAAISYKGVQYPEVQTSVSNELLNDSEIKNIDTLILPEYSHYFYDNSEEDRKSLNDLMNKSGLVIHSRRESEESFGKNNLIFMTPDGNILNSQYKWLTVPAGEYIPYVYQVILAYAGQEDLLLDFRNQKTIIPASQKEKPYSHNDVTYGSLVCSGISAPLRYRELTNEGATILTNSASLGALGVNQKYHRISEMMSKRYAIDNARPLIQSAKDAPAFIYDHNGRLIAKTDNPNQLITGSVTSNTRKTPYAKYGDWIVALSLLILIIYMFISNKRKVLYSFVKKAKAQ